jgi:hypothetical protein
VEEEPVDTYINRFEKLIYANEAYTRTAALEALAEAYVAVARGWLLEAASLWEEALGGSSEVAAALRDNKVEIDAARAKGKQALDVVHAALKALAKSTGSEAGLRAVFPDGTVTGIGKGDLSVLACLGRARAVVTAEGAAPGVAAYMVQVVGAHETYAEAFGFRSLKAGDRRQSTGISDKKAGEWHRRYFGACEAIRGLLRVHGREGEVPAFFPHLDVADRSGGGPSQPPGDGPGTPTS